MTVQDTPRMAAHLRDTQGGNELVERAGAPPVDGLLEPGKGFLPKPGAGDDLGLMALQLIEVPEILDPAAVHKGLQRLLRQALNLHAGLAAEVDELAHQPGRTVQVLTVELLSSARTHVDYQHLAAAGTHGRDRAAAASGVVLRDRKSVV